jgi:hypothetical protein
VLAAVDIAVDVRQPFTLDALAAALLVALQVVPLFRVISAPKAVDREARPEPRPLVTRDGRLMSGTWRRSASLDSLFRVGLALCLVLE